MLDTRFIECGRERPRRYTPDEIELIEKSLPQKIGRFSLEKLQRAVQDYQWARWADGLTKNSRRKEQLEKIFSLCARASIDEIEMALNELDAPISQELGSVGPADRSGLALAVTRVRQEIPRRGPNRKRARRQFIGRLASIFYCVTLERPTRRYNAYREEEYGPFLKFVRAALTPFDAEKGCEADIKAVLRQGGQQPNNCHTVSFPPRYSIPQEQPTKTFP